MDNRPPLVLIVAAKWWPLSARLAIELLRQHCRLSALCPKGHPLTHIRGLESVEQYRGVTSIRCLSRAMHALRPDVVIPCDDGVVAQLHALHAQDPALRALIEDSLGDARSFPITASRYRLLGLAAELGVLVPETRRAATPDALATWHGQNGPAAVLKVDGECGGNGVRICNSLEESITAWRELNSQISRGTAWKRQIIDRNPLALWAYRNRKPPDVTIQQLVRGQPANCMLASRRGEVIDIVSVAVLATDGPTGAATVIQRIKNHDMERAAKKLAARLGLTGFYGLDFMIDSASGAAYLIEMNPRCTQLGHLRFDARPSLAEAFLANLRDESPKSTRDPLPMDTVALFPQALNFVVGNDDETALDSYLDVPWEEPDLVAELRKDAWPRRRLLSRLYHAFRPTPRSRCVRYETNSVAGEIPAARHG